MFSRDFLRDNLKRKGQQNLVLFPRESGHKSKDIFLWGSVGSCCWFGGRTVRVRTVRTSEEKGILRQPCCTQTKAPVWYFSLLLGAIFCAVHTVGTWHNFLCAVQLGRTALWACFPRQQIVVAVLCGCKWFLLLENCISAPDIDFLKLNKISLIGFTHNGVFPGWLPNFWVQMCL